MAEGFARLRGLEAQSAGVRVGHPGQKMSDFPEIVECMSRIGYANLNTHERKQLSAEMIKRADKVIVMVDENFWPDFLSAARQKVEYHDVPDPNCASYVELCAVRDRVKEIVEGLEKL